MKKVILDTNVLLVCVSNKSKFHYIFENLINKKYILCVTTEILAEYAEIIELHMGFYASHSVLGVLDALKNVHFITTHFKFNLLKDVDDNKFVDCAIAGNADFIVSEDKHFNVLENIDFPKVKVIKVDEFLKELKN